MLVDTFKLKDAITSIIPKEINLEDVLFLCIGTDRSTGDSLAPLVGKILVEKGYINVMGTLKSPVHAGNLYEKLSEIANSKFVIAIDACLGKVTSVGKIVVGKGKMSPGAGVGKELPQVGDCFITPVVNVGGFMEYFVLQNTRLSFVYDLAESVADALIDRFPMNTLKRSKDDYRKNIRNKKKTSCL